MASFPPPYPQPVRPSPLDVVSPAFARTNAMLLRRPFKLWRSWKLAAMSYLALLGSFFLPAPLLLPIAYVMRPDLFAALPSGFMPFATGVAVFYLVVAIIFFYLGVRIQLVQFEMIVTMADRLGPMWKRQGPRVWPWMGFKIALGTALTALLAPLIVGLISHFTGELGSIMAMLTPQNKPDLDVFYRFEAIFFGFYAVLIAVYMVFVLVATLLDDFVLPFYELEGLTVGAALSRGWKLLIAEPLQMFFYLIVKTFLAIMGYMAAGVAAQICAIPLVLVVVLGAVGVAVMTPAGHQGAPSAGVILLFVLVGLLLYAALIFIMFGIYGYVMTMLESYALYFVGSRYRPLGELMNPRYGPPPPFSPPPPLPSSEEDDDDGPPLPMDPVLA